MASSSFYKFNQWVQDMGAALYSLNACSTLYISLTNTLPNTADIKMDTTTGTCTLGSTSNAAEIATASGYTKKGFNLTSVVWANTSGTSKLYAAVATWTAGASIGPFQYAVLWNDAGLTTATRPIIAWFNYGTPVTLGVGETFTVGNSNDGTAWTATYPILTLA